ncbi:unnamed protein product [Haemonchus placei]|uniref:Uncharacterized protein n=1 Tax=Haemonchus placei TaxID=6290 RepID=A0A0N4X952_HAEPC|nr:unnamed protein product [Haemonchus placei]
MELREDPTASAPARDADDYPKMPEIAFDKDTNNGSAAEEEETLTTTSLTVSLTDEMQLSALLLNSLSFEALLLILGKTDHSLQ